MFVFRVILFSLTVSQTVPGPMGRPVVKLPEISVCIAGCHRCWQSFLRSSAYNRFRILSSWRIVLADSSLWSSRYV